MPDFIKSSTPQQRHDLAMKWVKFYNQHQAGRGIDTSDRDKDEYIRDNS